MRIFQALVRIGRLSYAIAHRARCLLLPRFSANRPVRTSRLLSCPRSLGWPPLPNPPLEHATIFEMPRSVTEQDTTTSPPTILEKRSRPAHDSVSFPRYAAASVPQPDCSEINALTPSTLTVSARALTSLIAPMIKLLRSSICLPAPANDAVTLAALKGKARKARRPAAALDRRRARRPVETWSGRRNGAAFDRTEELLSFCNGTARLASKVHTGSARPMSADTGIGPK